MYLFDISVKRVYNTRTILPYECTDVDEQY